MTKTQKPFLNSAIRPKNRTSSKKSSIYNYINQTPELEKFRKHRKCRKRSHHQASKHGIPDWVSILERPEKANTREEFGHLEIDFVISSHGSTACVLSCRERKTRYSIKNYLLLDWVKSFSINKELRVYLPMRCLDRMTPQEAFERELALNST